MSDHSCGEAGSPTLTRPPNRPLSPCNATSTTESVGWKPIKYGSASASSAGPRRVMRGSPDEPWDRIRGAGPAGLEPQDSPSRESAQGFSIRRDSLVSRMT